MLAKKIFLSLLFVLLFSVAFCFQAFSDNTRGWLKPVEIKEDQEVPLGNYHALIIGINEYEEWPQLKTAVKDSRGLKDVLVNRYNFTEDQLVIKNDKEATREAIIRDLRKLASNLTDKDNFLIYFAGHGQLDDLTGDGYWVPVEGKLKAPETWVSHSIIKNILSSEKVKAKNIVVIADSCYSGTLLRGGPSLLSLDDEGYRTKLLKLASRRSRQVVTSGGLEPIADGGRDGHSLFAYYFLKGLEQNKRDVIDIENLFHTYVWKPVTEIGGQRPSVGRLKSPMDEDGQFVLELQMNIIGKISKIAESDSDNVVIRDGNFISKGTGIVLDTITGFEWVSGPDMDTDWQKAKEWAGELMIDGGGWGLPTRNELKTLFFKGKGTRNMTPLLKTSGWNVWAEEADDTLTACSFGFLYGEPDCRKARHVSRDHRVFALRSKNRQYINSIGMKFALIPAGTFFMGTKWDSMYRREYLRETPRHRITITKPFYLQTTEVTQEQWKKIMGNNPSEFQDCGENCPVDNVSWNDAQEFIRKLNTLDPGKNYRLPTEAEWEYACRSGSNSLFHFGDDYDKLGVYAWYRDNSRHRIHPVSQKMPNPWGLYDMHGNVGEWCQDWYASSYRGNYAKISEKDPDGWVRAEYKRSGKDPLGPPEGIARVVRGGSLERDAFEVRSAFRLGYKPDSRRKWRCILGFRVARDY